MTSPFNSGFKGSFFGVTDPHDAADAAKRETEAKIKKLKQERDDKAKSLFTKLEDQRKVYQEAKVNYYKSESVNRGLKSKVRSYHGKNLLTLKNYNEKYEKSSKKMDVAKSVRNNELSRLESYTHEYCSYQMRTLSMSIFWE